MVILGLLGAWLSRGPHPNVAKAADNDHPSLHKKYRGAKTPARRLYSSAVQHRGATLPLSLTPEVPAMKTISSRAIATAFASMLLMGSAFAQTAAPAAKAEKAPAVHSAASLECSKEADAKGLHGKERKKFRSECKRSAAEKK
jgi:hypothetical protein